MSSRDLDTEVQALEAELKSLGSEERAVNEKRYLKSPLEHYGVTVSAIRKTVKAFIRRHGPLPLDHLRRLVAELWQRPVHEPRMAAIMLLEDAAERMEPEDLDLVEEMLRECFAWAYVDNLSANVAGTLITRYPDRADELDRWAQDENFWLRRSALLALMLPLRRGEGDWERFTRYADAMLHEKEFFVRKAIGWVLREASKQAPDRVQVYLEDRIDRVSGLTLREGSKKLPEPVQGSLRSAHKAAS